MDSAESSHKDLVRDASLQLTLLLPCKVTSVGNDHIWELEHCTPLCYIYILQVRNHYVSSLNNNESFIKHTAPYILLPATPFLNI